MVAVYSKLVYSLDLHACIDHRLQTHCNVGLCTFQEKELPVADFPTRGIRRHECYNESSVAAIIVDHALALGRVQGAAGEAELELLHTVRADIGFVVGTCHRDVT